MYRSERQELTVGDRPVSLWRPGRHTCVTTASMSARRSEGELWSRALRGDGTPSLRQAGPYRRELEVHSFRMHGSAEDAESRDGGNDGRQLLAGTRFAATDRRAKARATGTDPVGYLTETPGPGRNSPIRRETKSG